jgi:RNA polymerase sigma-32 factor
MKYKETGDPALAQKMVMANLRFVVKIAAEYSKFGPRMIDVIQEGNLGLMHAVKEFNPYKGVRLITYAVWWIRGYIREYLMRQYSMVRLGTTHNQKKLFYQLQQEEKKLGALGFKVDTPLLSTRLGISEEEIDSMRMRLKGRDLSLDQPLDNNSQSILLDRQTSSNAEAVDEQMEQRELLERLRQDIETVRPRLNEKEILILDHRLLADDPMTLQEVGDKMGITRERARQLEARVVLRIKEELEKNLGETIPPEKD